jgi:hypothetical protein
MAIGAEIKSYGWLGAVAPRLPALTTAGVVGAEAALGYNAFAPSPVMLGNGVRNTVRFGDSEVIATARSGRLAELLPESSLTRRQLALHAELSEAGATGTFRKRDVSMNDLVALGRVTGDEYSMFTNKGSRLIIRGDGSDVVVSPEMYDDLMAGKYGRFSGHTHPPGYSVMPGPEDRPFLSKFGQERSTIWGFDGEGIKRYTFGQHGLADDVRIASDIARRNWARLYGQQ